MHIDTMSIKKISDPQLSSHGKQSQNSLEKSREKKKELKLNIPPASAEARGWAGNGPELLRLNPPPVEGLAGIRDFAEALGVA